MLAESTPRLDERAARISQLKRSAGIWLLSICAGAGAVFVLSTAGAPGLLRNLSVPWWAIAIGFYVAECAVVHVHLRRETHTLSLSEIPLVLGLYAVSPLALVAAQVVGMGTALVFYRRQKPLKVVFNLAQSALGTALAAAVFRSILHGRDPFQPSGWVAGLTAASLAAAVGVVLVAGAVSLAEERPSLESVMTTATVSFLGTLTAASLALVAATLAETRPAAVALLLLPTAACALALRAYGLQRRRQDHVQSLYDSMPRRDEASELDSGVRQLLLAARRLLRAEYAELVILPVDPRELPLRSSMGLRNETLLESSELAPVEREAIEALHARGGLVTMAKDKHLPALASYMTERGLKDAILTRLEGENSLLGLLVVGNRADDVSTFGAEDEKLFRTFGGHAALMLENEQLEQSVAKLTELESKLRHQALHDALTGLPNRRLFQARVDETVQRPRSAVSEPAVLFIDLDGFKAINDDLGHAAGDELLVAFAERLRSNVRPEELPARLGGDEFAVLIESGTAEVAAEVAERLVDAVRNPFSIHGRRLSVRLSIGIATAGETSTVEELLANADLAMYAAKTEGSSSYAVYSEGMRGSAQARQALGQALEEALERDQIAVHYQPIVDLRTGSTVAFEALARWRRDESDTVAAADFLHAAEESALMERIGQVVLRTACIQTQEWRTEGDPSRELSVCVNLAPVEFTNARLGVGVAAALLESGLDASRLILEITEDVATADPQATLETMTELRRLGVRFALDEFGTGRSSLEQLCQLPFDVVKIARPLVERVGSGSGDERVTRAIVGLTRSLGVKVVAEGIESRAQADRLKQLGCQLGQGFYFDRALAAAQATRRLRTPASVPLRLVAADSA
ncbi:MAG TPA: EAL domain-containing protein [Gaiellaceae bacterium]|nr:EAL domain-containing protein [Gaiellaceae bacterium]